MRINNNIDALSTQNALFKVNRSLSKSFEKLSSGLRINKASDDAAGLAVSENLRKQVRGSSQAIKNTQDAIAMMQIADGALNEMSDIIQRMRELVIQAKNDTYKATADSGSERLYMGKEFLALFDELDRIAKVTNYNDMGLFARFTDSTNNTTDPKKTTLSTSIWDDVAQSVFGTTQGGKGRHFNIMVGANYTDDDISSANGAGQGYSFDPNAENLITIQFGEMDTNGLFRNNAASVTDIRRSLLAVTGTNPFVQITTGVFGAYNQARFGNNEQEKLSNILSLIDNTDLQFGSAGNEVTTGTNITGLARIGTMRSYIGAMVNRLESNVNNLMTSVANQQAAESLIRDVDYASETAEMTRQSILSKSATAMLAQANIKPQSILSLIR